MSSGIAKQSDAAHIIELAALGIESAAGIRIVGGQRGDDLRNRQVVSINPCGIEQHLILHDGATESRIVRHSGNRFVGSLDYPVFNGFQFLRTAIGALEDITINQAHWD